MTRTVFFHIGSVKTGTTGLHKFCYENRDALLEQDVNYVQFQPPQLHLPRWANADYLMNQDFDPGVVVEAINASPQSKILISDEALMGRPQIWQHPVFRDMRRVVILYLRNSVELVASWASENSLPYNFRQVEHSTGRGVVSVDEGIGFCSMKYRGLLLQFLNAVQSDSDLGVVIRPFPPQLPDETLVENFFKILEVSETGIRDLVAMSGKDGANANVGSSRKYCDAAYLLSRLAYQYDIPHLYTKELVDTVYAQLQSGDSRKVIDTLSMPEKTFILNHLATTTSTLIEELQAPPMINEMPTVNRAAGNLYSSISSGEITQLFLEYFVRRLASRAKTKVPVPGR